MAQECTINDLELVNSLKDTYRFILEDTVTDSDTKAVLLSTLKQYIAKDSEFTISKEKLNSIIKKEDGYYVKDFSNEITELQDKTIPIADVTNVGGIFAETITENDTDYNIPIKISDKGYLFASSNVKITDFTDEQVSSVISYLFG